MKHFLSIRTAALASLLAAVCLSQQAVAATFVDDAAQPYGTFNDVDYVVHTGRFEGTTSLGAFRVPYEIVAPGDASLGTRTLLVEPPHFSLGTLGRDVVLGRAFLFDKGLRYAAVGFGLNGLNILDPLADDLVVAGSPVVPPVAVSPGSVVDEEILIQFTQALTTDPFATGILGSIDRRYAYGASQTAAVLLESLLGPSGQGLFDLTILHVALWRAQLPPPFAQGGVFDYLPDGSPTPVPFVPPAGVGKVVFVSSEGDQIVSDSEFFRVAVGEPDYRLYEVAGAAHLPAPTNPLDHLMIVRALFVRADEWVRWGVQPPPSTLIEEDTSGGIDPVYGFPTGIARDGDLNALGGVRLPDLAVGRAQFIASDSSIGFPITIPGLIGNMVDLACEPPAGETGGPRFSSHGDYVGAFVEQVNALRAAGFLLDADAELLKEQASESSVGKPGTCP